MKKPITFLAFIFCATFGLKAQVSQKATIVFVRTFNLIGSGIGYNVFTDSTKLIRMRPQTFEVVEVNAKPTRFWAQTETKRHLDLDLRPNHIYFVEGHLTTGFFIGHPRLQTLSVDEFRNLVSKSDYLQKQLKKAGFETIHDFLRPYEVVNISGIWTCACINHKFC